MAYPLAKHRRSNFRNLIMEWQNGDLEINEFTEHTVATET